MREKKTACVGKDVVLVSVKDIAALLWHNCRYEGIWLVENVPRFEVPLHKGKPTRGIKYKRRLDDCKRGGGQEMQINWWPITGKAGEGHYDRPYLPRMSTCWGHLAEGIARGSATWGISHAVGCERHTAEATWGRSAL